MNFVLFDSLVFRAAVPVHPGHTQRHCIYTLDMFLTTCNLFNSIWCDKWNQLKQWVPTVVWRHNGLWTLKQIGWMEKGGARIQTKDKGSQVSIEKCWWKDNENQCYPPGTPAGPSGPTYPIIPGLPGGPGSPLSPFGPGGPGCWQ